MNKKVNLKGITWDHSRGFCPMVATAQRFTEIHGNVSIEWTKRSLQEFADEPIEFLASKYDLLVIDHPWAGFAADSGIIQPLDQLLPEGFCEDQSTHSVGRSFESYQFGGHLFALPIDAAAPVACSRPDLLQQLNVALPNTFDDLLLLAQKGYVAMPGIAIDTLMNFYMMCCGLGEDPFQKKDMVVSEKNGIQALEMLKALAAYINPEFFHWNPIHVYEVMTATDDLLYCPWAYGYVNYSRKGYAQKKIAFHDIINLDNDRVFCSTLGGTGLAISAQCMHVDEAIDYVSFVASANIQKTLYFDSGGQPGHGKAWEDEHVNNLSTNFFRSTLKTLDNAFLRPRYNGYMHFQDHAGDVIRNYLMKGDREQKVMQRINELYRESKTKR